MHRWVFGTNSLAYCYVFIPASSANCMIMNSFAGKITFFVYRTFTKLMICGLIDRNLVLKVVHVMHCCWRIPHTVVCWELHVHIGSWRNGTGTWSLSREICCWHRWAWHFSIMQQSIPGQMDQRYGVSSRPSYTFPYWPLSSTPSCRIWPRRLSDNWFHNRLFSWRNSCFFGSPYFLRSESSLYDGHACHPSYKLHLLKTGQSYVCCSYSTILANHMCSVTCNFFRQNFLGSRVSESSLISLSYVQYRGRSV